ncbi:MAG: HPr family phosphocarrier protein [Ruminococcaceae bacterium]|nr:HPr family phosphocarrier protein [Oscillospiraceae bacterium]HHV32433.1 HPr family phosphocarrier protein [Clostridiales bacterium]
MKEFTYQIKDADGLHARPAGLLVKCVKECSSNITLSVNGKSADAKRLFAVMGLCVKQNDLVTFTVEGPEENADCAKLKEFCEANI